jgi:hemolysin activation/secretion protein
MVAAEATPRGSPRLGVGILCFLCVLFARSAAFGGEIPGFFFISEFQVHGVHSMSSMDVQRAVYPFLGPNRVQEDIQAACTALEKAYQSKGFGAATVQPAGKLSRTGVIELEVSEGTVERLRVKGARYYSPEVIKKEAPALAEGRVLNFNDINKDVVGLNQSQERTVTPTLKPGSEPGTYDIDLDVKDSSPAHASIELNDDRSPNTKPLRLVASVSDSNLWQSGDGAGFTFQEAPQRRLDSEVFSGYFLAHVPGSNRLTLMLQGTKQDSNISTLGGSTVAGPGQTFELKANYQLPNGKDWDSGKDWADFTHSFSLSVDYKHFRQSVDLTPASGSSTTGTIVTPITYYPIKAEYSATWSGPGGKGSSTSVDASVTFNLRGMGGGPNEFDLNRYGADGGFVVFKADVSRTQELPGGFEAYGRVQGQLANQPLVSSEEYSGGGEDTVRGYLESEVVGDDGAFGSLELRSPSFLEKAKLHGDWRVFVFGDAGELTLLTPLPEQTSHFTLSSAGAGSRLSLLDHASGSFFIAYPFVSQAYTQARDLQMRFQLRLEY